MEDMSFLDDETLEKKRRSSQQRRPKPHPMRTDLWQLQFSVLPSLQQSRALLGLSTQNNTIEMTFSENGFVRVESSKTNDIKQQGRHSIGKWKLHPSGLSWKIPVLSQPTKVTTQENEDDELESNQPTTTLYYHTDLILNPFGPRPTMVRGTVTRDRFASNPFLTKCWFRPVIATFTGVGIGQDTADASYGDRAFGLSKQPPAPEN